MLSNLDSDNSDGAGSVVSAHSDAHEETLPVRLSNPDAHHKHTSGEYKYLDDLLDDLHNYRVSAGFSVYKIRSVNYVKGFGAT